MSNITLFHSTSDIICHRSDTVTYYAMIMHMQSFLWQYTGSNYRHRVYIHASLVPMHACRLSFLRGPGNEAIPMHACIAGNNCNSGHMIRWKYATSNSIGGCMTGGQLGVCISVQCQGLSLDKIIDIHAYSIIKHSQSLMKVIVLIIMTHHTGSYYKSISFVTTQ